MKTKYFIALAALGLTCASMAGGTPAVTGNNIVGEQGSTAVLEIHMANSESQNDLQLDLLMSSPEISVETISGAFNVGVTERTLTHMAQMSNPDEGEYRFVLLSLSQTPIATGSGQIATIALKLDAAPGNYTYTLSGIEVSKVTINGNTAINTASYPTDFTGNIVVTEGGEQRYGKNQLYCNDIFVREGEDAELKISYNSETVLYQYSASIALPQGVDVSDVNFNEAVAIDNFSNNWNFSQGVLTLSGSCGRKGPQAASGNHIFATATLKTSSLPAGVYTIRITDQYLSNVDDDYSPADYEAKLTIVAGERPSTTRGDVNEDGIVNIGDISEIIAIILGL